MSNHSLINVHPCVHKYTGIYAHFNMHVYKDEHSHTCSFLSGDHCRYLKMPKVSDYLLQAYFVLHTFIYT